MITKAQIKHIRSLADKKYRTLYKEFVVEGSKNVLEACHSEAPIMQIFAISSWIEQNQSTLHSQRSLQLNEVEPHQMSQISFLSTPSDVLAVVAIQETSIPSTQSLSLLLEEVQDPGNVGTMIRIANWFGIEAIYLYGACADPYHPKTVQAAMGSIHKVSVINLTSTQELEKLLNENILVVATLQGTSIKDFCWPPNCLIAIGNESKGISNYLKEKASHNVSIPGSGNAESLNAAVACGILCFTATQA